MRSVGGEVVPEIIKIDTLASSDQLFRRWPVEAKVPNAGIIVDILPPRYPGKKRIHDHQFLGFCRELRGVSVGDHESNVMADHLGFLNAQRFRKRMDTDR